MKSWQALLFPITAIYRTVTDVRNALYERDFISSASFSVPVIVVGNLTVGGTGKTPHVAWLVKFLYSLGLDVAVISRGYGRNTSGFILADENATAETIGDEPMTYCRQFPGLTVAVGEKRAEAITNVLRLKPRTQVILLDDAFQHRAVRGSLNLLLTDYGRLFTRDFVLPTGLLRESRDGAKRVDAVIVTKCPDKLSEAERNQIKTEISRYTVFNTPVFFTGYQYGKKVSIGKNIEVSRQIILVTGIAQADLLINYLNSQHYQIIRHFNYRDHYSYSEKDLAEINLEWEKSGRFAAIFTTSKDAVKLQKPQWASIIRELPVFYIPIEVTFQGGQREFEKLISLSAGIPEREIT